MRPIRLGSARLELTPLPAAAAAALPDDRAAASRVIGYATEAARSLVDWAVRNPGIREVTARSEPENEASARVLRAAGFEPIGESRGVVRWRRTGT